ncbi:chloride channel protein, CIC family [Raineyella antarctica]|uniref:Chloride channel protein, CIC family n=1 Tax=Raineyella antarctica TaxID=1577474 RepID=A0A1G6GFG6_9ACTN|nr:ClC family H(+)/Cl(-) exchange transporter [Raineyella antarctica]SDB80700.1 chloride channel protein, CIC family [Raineyella antarctica]
MDRPGGHPLWRRLGSSVWPPAVEADRPGGLLGFTTTAVLVGMLTGLMAASFRWALDRVSEARDTLVSWAHGDPALGLVVVVVVCALATATAAALVHRVEPHAEGSGIPRVEAVVEGRTRPGSPLILPVKYVGGLLAIGAGLALGREGPSVQMGGNIGIILSRLTRRGSHDLRILVAAGAAAGLATAFNAPLAGGVFVLEELVKRFDPRTTVATLLASGAGFASAHLFLGDTTELFRTAPMGQPRLAHAGVVFVVGLLAGLAGVGYNAMIMSSLRYADASRVPREVRAGLIGAGVGLVAFLAPGLVGGGDGLTQQALLAEGGVLTVLGILAARLVLGVVSYAAATPGGLFAPMLVVGSHLGLLVGLLGQQLVPQWTPEPAALALIGTAAFFTASVRAPITGLVLTTELTGVTSQLPPMLGACAIAMLVATLLRSEPIYDALTTRATHASRQNVAEGA